MVNNKYILGLGVLCGSAVHGSLIPHRYLGLHDDHYKLDEEKESMSETLVNSHLNTASSHPLDNKVPEEFVIPTSLEQYASQWQKLYNNLKFHSSMHQPGFVFSNSPGSKGVKNFKYLKENNGSNMLELDNLKHEKDYDYKNYGMDLTGNNDQNKDGSDEYIDNNYAIEDPNERIAGNNEAFNHTLKVFKREIITLPFPKSRRSLGNEESIDASIDSIRSEFYNDELEEDEYEFGYDDRDEYLVDFLAIDAMDSHRKRVLSEEETARLQRCAQRAMNDSLMKNTTGIASDVPVNNTNVEEMYSTSRSEATGTAIRPLSDAMLSFAIAFAFSLMLL